MVRLEEMSRSALAEIVDRYPWFAAARAVLLHKVLDVFGIDAAQGQYGSDRLYFPCGERISADIYAAISGCNSYEDSGAILKDVLDKPVTEIFDGTDFFSRRQYEAVRRTEDLSIGKIAVVDYSKPAPDTGRTVKDTVDRLDVFSETLAGIYVEQGYPERAIEIYRALSLQSPEKSAYFASLIGKLKS